ncbi:MAG: ABC transporter permease [Deferribacteraceae bacterium]|jgi:phospholipid/cholesterol/gamma-HCH transport system permease protein|nr:ABC transporter permease [Deferribacteraceae bacterium]
MNLFEFIGKLTLSVVRTTGGLCIMLWDSLRWGFRPPYRKGLIFEQLDFVGVQSIPIVILTGTFTGMVFAFQSYIGFSEFGAESMTGTVVALAMARELGPVLSSIMVTARAGSAMTAELGTMRVTEQIDALYVLAVEPLQYLVSPRITASVIAMPMLNLIAVFFGILGGYLVSVIALGINSNLFIRGILTYVDMGDIMSGTVKAAVFGLILSLVGCYKGFFTSGGALGVGRATTESVVLSCILILFFDYILTAVMF